LRERYPRVARFYTIDLGKENGALCLEWSLLEESAAEVATLEGTCLPRTNRVDWSAAAVWKTYMQLTQVESAFRHLKSTLRLRPMRHNW